MSTLRDLFNTLVKVALAWVGLVLFIGIMGVCESYYKAYWADHSTEISIDIDAFGKTVDVSNHRDSKLRDCQLFVNSKLYKSERFYIDPKSYREIGFTDLTKEDGTRFDFDKTDILDLHVICGAWTLDPIGGQWARVAKH